MKDQHFPDEELGPGLAETDDLVQLAFQRNRYGGEARYGNALRRFAAQAASAALRSDTLSDECETKLLLWLARNP